MKRKYVVVVEADSSNVDTEIQSHEANNDSSYVQEVCYEVTKVEYEHTLGRSTKLDQKIGFMFAVCAFLVTMLCDCIIVINAYSAFAVIYYFLLILTIIMFVVLLKELLDLLTTEQMKHYNPRCIIEQKLYQADIKTVVESICSSYTEVLYHNSDILDRKSVLFNRCVSLCTVTLIVVFILKILSKSFL